MRSILRRVFSSAVFPVLITMCACSKSDHPAIGHWQGTVTADGRVENAALLIDATSRPLRVALFYIPAGAYYTDCNDVSITERELTFRFARAKFDLEFYAASSTDGRTLTGTFIAPVDSMSAIEQGTFRFTRRPQAKNMANAMKFTALMPGGFGDYNLILLLAETDDGSWVAQVDMPEYRIDEMPLFNMKEEAGVITGSFRVAGPPMEFAMTLSEDRQRVTGTLTQGDRVDELDLKRVE